MKRAVQVLLFLVAWGAVLCLSAGRLDLLRGWIYLALYTAIFAATSALLLAKNPEVIAARAKLHKDAKRFDKVFTLVYSILLFVTPAVAGLEVRFGRTPIGFGAVYAGAALLVVGAVPIAGALLVNPFLETQVRIQSDRGHRVVTSGPYRLVRHPMYAGVLLNCVAVPLILGSWWAFIPAGVSVPLFVWRTIMEDRTLRKELPGYEDYARTTRYRLLPGVW